ncbi:SPOR domain-containing protein [Futiania mangrovi]|uniref:SPOR domain-containing protein n=1 Tax=Futiania mangrovi TaxID=2959716 RepID=A0A9J6PHD4_9PROT|nr:SPOR domain-containing protein [Futiania mangrovii]MCP1335983.1 SPOR domain-containing protein [Futiania mangrovii]
MAVAIDDGGRPRRALVWAGGAFLSLFLFGAVIALSYNLGAREGGVGELPIIRADAGPLKVAPENPGGETFPHQNIGVYDRISGEMRPVVEQLMPPVEEPALPAEAGGTGPRVIDGGAGSETAAATPRPGGDSATGSAEAGSGAPAPAGEETKAAGLSMEDLLKRDVPEAAAPERAGIAEAPKAAADAADKVADTAADKLAARVTGETPVPAKPAETEPAAVSKAAPETSAPGTPRVVEQQVPTPQTTVDAGSSGPPRVLGEGAQPVAQTPAPAEAPPPAKPAAQAATGTQPEPKTQVAALQPAQQAPQPASSLTGVRIQIGSFRTREQAEEAWQAAAQKHKDLLAGLRPAIERADLGQRGVFHRVQIGPLENRASAASLCKLLDERGQPCIVATK